MTKTLDLATLVLGTGTHTSIDDGACLLEAISYFAGEPWSANPACVSPVIAAFGRLWNDHLDDEGRQRLVPLISLMVGTNTGSADEEARAWLITDWMVRTYLPIWLRLGGMVAQAESVAALAPLTTAADWSQARPTISSAGRAAGRAAAGAAAEDAAWATAGAAAWAAGRAGGGAAAWAAGRAGGAAWDAAWDAARAAAWAAARAAAGAAAGDAAWDAARAAARDALRPTVAVLQESAFELLRVLCAVGRDATLSASTPSP